MTKFTNLDTDQKAPATSQKKPFSRWTIVASILIAPAIVLMFLTYVKTGVIFSAVAFVLAIVSLIVQIKNRGKLKGLILSIIVLILSIILCVIHLAILVYYSGPMSLARDFATYFDKEDVDQEFSNVAQLVSSSSNWKELRSEKLGYVFQYPEDWTVDVSADEKIVIIQWQKGEETVAVECKTLFTIGELRAEQSLADYIEDSYAWLEKEHTTKEITIGSYTGYRTEVDLGDYGFTDWLSSGSTVFSFKQENSGGEKEACQSISQRIENSFTLSSTE